MALSVTLVLNFKQNMELNEGHDIFFFEITAEIKQNKFILYGQCLRGILTQLPHMISHFQNKSSETKSTATS